MSFGLSPKLVKCDVSKKAMGSAADPGLSCSIQVECHVAVKLTSGGKSLFPLTSPPSKPIPAPEPTLIAKVVSYEDREIIVTVPFSDSIELVAGVTNDILLVPDISGKSAKQLYTELDQEIQDLLVEVAQNLPPFISGKVNPNNPTQAKFYISYDDVQPLSKARVTLSRKKGVDYASWHIRCEFSRIRPVQRDS